MVKNENGQIFKCQMLKCFKCLCELRGCDACVQFVSVLVHSHQVFAALFIF